LRTPTSTDNTSPSRSGSSSEGVDDDVVARGADGGGKRGFAVAGVAEKTAVPPRFGCVRRRPFNCLALTRRDGGANQRNVSAVPVRLPESIQLSSE